MRLNKALSGHEELQVQSELNDKRAVLVHAFKM